MEIIIHSMFQTDSDLYFHYIYNQTKKQTLFEYFAATQFAQLVVISGMRVSGCAEVTGSVPHVLSPVARPKQVRLGRFSDSVSKTASYSVE